MDTKTIHKLVDINNEFYRSNSQSFSQTRSHAWGGWNHLLSLLPKQHLSVLDAACGNMRFKSFLDENVTGQVCYYALDSCLELVPDVSPDSFQQIDIIDSLLSGRFPQCVNAQECDLVVCFGFMHHIPTFELRMQLLQGLLEKAKPNGVVAVSFWRFTQDSKLLEKAQESTQHALSVYDVKLEDNDYFLGWQDQGGAFRYCHSFSDKEINLLAAAFLDDAQLVDRFEADGRTGNMNTYLVLRKRSA